MSNAVAKAKYHTGMARDINSFMGAGPRLGGVCVCWLLAVGCADLELVPVGYSTAQHSTPARALVRSEVVVVVYIRTYCNSPYSVVITYAALPPDGSSPCQPPPNSKSSEAGELSLAIASGCYKIARHGWSSLLYIVIQEVLAGLGATAG